MTDTASETDRTLAVYPIADYPENGLDRLMDESLRPDDTIDLFGYCADFCVAHEGKPSGLSVAEHGPWCSSRMCALVDGKDERGEDSQISASLVRLYTHGVYRESEMQLDLARWHDTFARVALADEGGDDTPAILVSVGDARRLAAGLLYAADAAEDLLRDINEAAARRGRRD